jgi:cbb3-type cytochrome oxidase subunit 3
MIAKIRIVALVWIAIMFICVVVKLAINWGCR